MSEKRGYLVESITVLLSPVLDTAEIAGEMTVEEMTAAEKGTMNGCLQEETRIVIATTADGDEVEAIVEAAAGAGAKTGSETETEIGTETAHGAGPTAGVAPGAGVEREMQERVAQKVVMFTHLLQLLLYHPHQQPCSLSHL